MALRKVGFFQEDGRSNLPDELLVNILSRLTLKELLNARLVSQLFARLGLDDNVWAALFEKHFGVKITGPNCMQKFIIHYRCERIMGIASKTFLDNLDVELVDAVLSEYYLLTKFAMADKEGSDVIWTSYLRAKFLINMSYSIALVLTLEKDFTSRWALLTQAVYLGNPLAMLEVAATGFNVDNIAAEIKSALFVTKARNNECLEVIYRLAKLYFEPANIKNYFELLIKAAKGGHAQAAYELALGYSATYQEPEYIPLGDKEWESSDLIGGIYEKMKAAVLTPEILAELAEYQFKLITLAKNGALSAAYVLRFFNEQGEPLLGIKRNNRLAIYYRETELKLYEANKPARKERTLYWIEEAAKGGCMEAIAWVKMNKEKEEKKEKDTSASADGYSPRI